MMDKTEMEYGKEEMLPRVVAIEEIQGDKMVLRFDNGELRVFDADYLFDMSVYQRHNLENVFRFARVEFDTIVWPGDIDIAPETLYLKSVPIEKTPY